MQGGEVLGYQFEPRRDSTMAVVNKLTSKMTKICFLMRRNLSFVWAP